MDHPDVPRFLANLLVILFSARLFGELAERFKQPAVLGELIGGVFLGLGLITFFHPHDPALTLMAQFGILLLLFETGLESDFPQLIKVGPMALAVACTGVALPFIIGYGVMTAMGHGGLPSVLIAGALTATSVGITARVLADLGRLGRPEAQIIMGAAVIDDILGVVLLSIVEAMARTGQISWLNALRSSLLPVAFIVAAVLLGPFFSRVLLKTVERMRSRGALITGSICFVFALALLAKNLGTAMIIGAFAAGMLLARTERKAEIQTSLNPVADIFVPVFFVMIGANIQLQHYAPWAPENSSTLALTAALVGVAILSKLASGWAAWKPGLNHAAIGIGMIPRGEVGLIFAQVGLESHVISPGLYAALIGLVIFTTFITPPLLKRHFL